jgi:phenylacetic acid degradation protein paaN
MQAPAEHSLFERHRAVLDGALAAAASRAYWSAYPEAPSGKIYGEPAKADGEAAFEALIGKPFDLPGHPATARVGHERSPYGRDLGVTYPAASPEDLVAASKAAGEAWAKAPIEARVGVCLEILARLNRQSFLIANAVMHTSGQAFVMAFQAGGPHAQDRALEAVAYAYAEMTRTPREARWEKPQGKADPIVALKRFRIVPRGVALAIGCATFPTWNSYPGLFASLATGNTVIVKPHPGAILPLALTVKIAREVLAEQGFDPNVALLAADDAERPITKELVEHPEVRIVDFTGSPAFGAWVREAARTKEVYTEEAGVNSIVVHSTANLKGMAANIAFSLSLYAGQMCTAPQNIFVPAEIDTDQGRKSFAEVAEAIKAAVDKLLADPERAAGVLGAIQSEATLERIREARGLGRVLRDSAEAPVPGFPEARTASPLLLEVEAAETRAYAAERFGPIAFVVRVTDADEGLAIAARTAKQHGAITAAVHSTDEAFVERAADAFAEAGVALSVNLTGGLFVNQSAAFSDFHVSGANPAGTASLTDAAFVARRFRIAPIRVQNAA